METTTPCFMYTGKVGQLYGMYEDAKEGGEKLEKFQCWLKEQREKRGWTKKRLAELIDIEPGNIGKYEGSAARSTLPSRKTFKKIRIALGYVQDQEAVNNKEVANTEDIETEIEPFSKWAAKIVAHAAINYGVIVRFEKILNA